MYFSVTDMAPKTPSMDIDKLDISRCFSAEMSHLDILHLLPTLQTLLIIGIRPPKLIGRIWKSLALIQWPTKAKPIQLHIEP